MIASLILIHDKMNPPAPETQAFFDTQSPLQQLQLEQEWLAIDNQVITCSETVTNCQQWANAWQMLALSPLLAAPAISSSPLELLIQAGNLSEMQLWLYFPQQKLLKSPANNWFAIPPSLNAALTPMTNANR
ncbi:hypothetical protein [Shewanella sp. NIFS-20-20]|uniref:hypothetical protein n=1 Tax=Shewanella sp. NIFS-20-20 TaxID=2853806 RepID=UPI001C458D0F|nr:hypothetical protein [Shewanella sp. NIFS-20-20]MBV7316046.1 hypothetical protein [Shewanella sp. NIFS-20-20]